MAWIEEINTPKLMPNLGESDNDVVKVYRALRQMGYLKDHNTYAYKPVDRKVRPIPGVMPEEARTIRRIPEDPLLTLPKLTPHPPEFTPTAKVTAERMDSLHLNPTGFLWPEEVKLVQLVIVLNEKAIAFDKSERAVSELVPNPC